MRLCREVLHTHLNRSSMHLLWTKQRTFSRLIFLKRAQVYHSGRVFVSSLCRQRTPEVDLLLEDLVEFSLSPYTRIRRYILGPNRMCGYMG
jgi:proteasome activator subunit 4